MTKYVAGSLLALVVALLSAAASEACWFRCGHCPAPCPSYPAVRYYPTVPTPSVALQPALKPERLLVGAKGRYRIIDTGERGDFFEKDEPNSPFAAASEEDFAGTDRRKAKISIASGMMEPPFANVHKLIASLPADETILGLGIPRGPTSDRVEQENRNVSVHGFIYAVKFEEDHDYHVILGMSPTAATQEFFNVEVSGLPPGGPHRATLKAARTAFQEFFQEHGSHFGSSYKKFDPPIPVRIEGSLFFDVDHKAGVVGPKGMRPDTAWEIHPVTKIEFEIDP